jgi:hypothetical protein
LNKSFCPLSRRSFGSIAISPTQTQPETWNHADSAKSNCKEIDIDIPKTGDIEYLQNPRNHSARTASAFFTGDYSSKAEAQSAMSKIPECSK